MKLSYLKDSELAEVERRARLSGIPIRQCPTCASIPDEYGERVQGTYIYEGLEEFCNCTEQIALRKIYLLANIPDLYMRLAWEDYKGPDKIKEIVLNYLDNWPSFKLYGLGLAFLSEQTGTGKTQLSTHIGKELIKRGESVFFLPFNQMLRALRYNDTATIDKLDNVNVVILDDIAAPPNDTFSGIFADNLEYVLRNRTNYNGTTLLSSNLTRPELEKHYPRVWSVLEPKLIDVEMSGDDARYGFVADRTLSMAMNGEVAPIV